MNAELKNKIETLKKKRNAVILAHNYQVKEVQEIADYVGDSLGLSRKAADTKVDVIVFCGVYFMAETASILSPERIVLIPDRNAGCPMADMVEADSLKKIKQKHSGVPVVSYVNTRASVKAVSDVCCTSSNAVDIVNSIDSDTIIFVPDKNLGAYVQARTDKELIIWPGYCPTHVKILPEDIEQARREHPEAEVMVHPECSPRVVEMADLAASTAGFCKRPLESDVDEFIVGTETGIISRLRKENPSCSFYPLTERAICPNMKRITLEKVQWSLEYMEYNVQVDKDIRGKAEQAIKKMLEMSS